MSLGLAALITWVGTVGFGSYLFGTWLARGGLSQLPLAFNRPPSYFPAPLVFGHVIMATTGLLVWIAYLLTDWKVLAWVAFTILLPVDLFGFSMFGRWLGSRRARVAIFGMDRDRGPAESRLPMAVVFSHGLCAGTTVLLVLATAVGIHGS